VGNLPVIYGLITGELPATFVTGNLTTLYTSNLNIRVLVDYLNKYSSTGTHSINK